VSSSYPGGSAPPNYGATSGGSSGYDTAGTSAADPDVEDQSIGGLIGRLSTHLSQLMRQEMALAKAEIRDEAQKAAKGAGMLAGAGFAGLMVAIFASITLMWLLDLALPITWAALIVTLLWAAVGAVLFLVGRKQLKQVNPKPEQTVESLKEDKEWLKAQKN
jgi:Putative Actinobacterial Holin-X, holin superfamily III